MNIYEANMFDSRKLNLRLFIDAMKLDKQLTGSYSLEISYLIAEQYNFKRRVLKKGSHIFSHVAKNSLRYSALQGLIKIFEAKSDYNINPNFPIFVKFSQGSMLPNPPSIGHGFAMPSILISLTHANLHLACMYKLHKAIK